ncbi:MAG: hypothetical protein K1X67_01555 [Fimbriimonadaceae bacterium]|nr:hypothetical protein [Fimbriimonadaceae bacterium]
MFWVGAGDTVEVRFESASGEVTWRKGLVGYFNPQGGPAFWVKFDDTGESEVVPCSAMRIVASVPRPRAEGLYYFSSLLDDMERWALFPANTRLDTEEIVDLSFDITLDHGVDEARRCFLALLAYHRYTMDPERRSWPLDRVKRFQWKGKKPKERGA